MMKIAEMGTGIRRNAVRACLSTRGLSKGLSKPAKPLHETLYAYSNKLNSTAKDIKIASILTVGIGLFLMPIIDMFSPTAGAASHFWNTFCTALPEDLFLFGGGADIGYFGLKGIKNSWRLSSVAKSVLKLDPASENFANSILPLKSLSNADQTILLHVIFGRKPGMGMKMAETLQLEMSAKAEMAAKKIRVAEEEAEEQAKKDLNANILAANKAEELKNKPAKQQIEEKEKTGGAQDVNKDQVGKGTGAPVETKDEQIQTQAPKTTEELIAHGMQTFGLAAKKLSEERAQVAKEREGLVGEVTEAVGQVFADKVIDFIKPIITPIITATVKEVMEKMNSKNEGGKIQ